MTERNDIERRLQELNEGESYSGTKLACKLLIERHGWSENLHVNVWMYFTKDGISLSDLRDSIESLEENND